MIRNGNTTMASLLRRRQPEDSYSPLEVDSSLLLSDTPIAPSDIAIFLGEEKSDEHGPPILNAFDTARVFEHAQEEFITKGEMKLRVVHLESASTGQFYSILEEQQDVNQGFDFEKTRNRKHSGAAPDETYTKVVVNKGHQTAVLLCGKLLIEQIFVACHALLAGLSLYPLIASHAGNINKEEFLTGYGPGSRVTRKLLFILSTLSLVGAWLNAVSGLNVVNRMERKERKLVAAVHQWSAMESTMRFVGAIAYGTCLLATLCCSPADAMMQYFYKASLKEGYDGIEWPENVMDNAFFDKSFDIWSIFTIVRACAALVGWFVTGFGLYRRGINAAVSQFSHIENFITPLLGRQSATQGQTCD